MGERVAVLDPEGKFATVDKADVDKLPPGARALSKAEVKERELDEEYAKKSLAEKATSIASMASPVIMAGRAAYKLATGQTGEIAPSLPPEMQAYYHGVSEGIGGGLPEIGVKKAIEMVAGPEAAHAYGQHTIDAAEAHPVASGLGTAAGFAGGILAGGAGAGIGRASLAIPGTAVGALGDAVEQGAGRLLAGVAERGVLGRMAAAGGSLAVRGAAEGALYNAASQFSDDMLQDHELSGQKLFAAAGTGALGGMLAGGGLGAGGSLLKSGVSAAGGRLARALAPAAEDAFAEGAAKADGAIAKEAATTNTGDLLTRARNGTSPEALRGVAYENAWRATGGRKAFAAEAEKYLPNGVKDVGEALMRHGVIDAEGGWINAAAKGAPQAIAERIEAPLAKVGSRIGEITSNSGITIPAQKVIGIFDETLGALQGKAGFESIARSVEDYKASLLDKLKIPPLPSDIGTYPPELQTKIQEALYKKAGGVKLEDLLAQRKALDELVYREGTPLNPSARIEELRAIRGKMEGLVADSLDGAESKVPGGLKNEYLGLKKDYQALRIGQKAAEDASTRGFANREYSLTDKIIGTGVGAAVSTGLGFLGGAAAGKAAAFASKVVRERGNAATAVLLHRVADANVVQKILSGVDAKIEAASKGLLQPAKALPASSEGKLVAATKASNVYRAQAIVRRVAEAQSNPEAYAARISKDAESLSQMAPKVAGAYTQSAIRASTFLASKIPVSAQPDPLNPDKRRRMSDADAAKLVRYADYCDHPQKFFDEVSRGKLTREGIETAKAVMPDAFAELQTRTAQALAELGERGLMVPYEQRERLGVLLDFAAVPAQRPEHMIYLQGNVQQAPPPGNMQGSPAKAAPAPKRPIQLKTQQSGYDRLESK